MKRSHQLLLSWLLGTLNTTLFVSAAEYDVPNDFATIQEAIDAAAENHEMNTITLGPGAIASGPLVVGWQFNEGNPLVIRPRAGQPRATIVSVNGGQPAITVAARYVTLQDLDVLRQASVRTNLVNLINCFEVTVERCRLGSVKPLIGAADPNSSYAAVHIVNPEYVVVRNCICFAVSQGTYDFGLRCITTTLQKSLFLYNNNVANHRAAGVILMDRFAGNRYVLRNNVVVNAPIALEPYAYASQVPVGAMILSSHNTAFASANRVEFVDHDAQPISGPAFFRLQLAPGMAPAAFVTTVWDTNPLDDPNPNFYRLLNGGALHNANPMVRGITVAVGVPNALDRGVFDDWESQPRPSGNPAHTDRGADQLEPTPVPLRDLIMPGPQPGVLPPPIDWQP